MGKYERVYQDLCLKIDNETYPVGSLLPSEKSLTEIYGVSRETARKALSLLTNRGYIQKIMGKGSVVIKHSQYALPVSSIVSYKEFSAQAQGTKTEVLALEKTQLPIGIFKDLDPNLTPHQVTHVGRLRYLDQEPAIIDNDYILTSLVPDIPLRAAQGSLYDYFEKDLGLNIAYSSKVIRVQPATEKDRQLLRLAKGEYVAVTVSMTSLDNTLTFQYTESRHRPDKFIYQDFARRH